MYIYIYIYVYTYIYIYIYTYIISIVFLTVYYIDTFRPSGARAPKDAAAQAALDINIGSPSSMIRNTGLAN